MQLLTSPVPRQFGWLCASVVEKMGSGAIFIFRLLIFEYNVEKLTSVVSHKLVT